MIFNFLKRFSKLNNKKKIIKKNEIEFLLKNDTKKYMDLLNKNYCFEYNLRGINLEGLDLRNCKFWGFDLQDANFKNCKLMADAFKYANIKDVNFEGAKFYKNTFSLGYKYNHGVENE